MSSTSEAAPNSASLDSLLTPSKPGFNEDNPRASVADSDLDSVRLDDDNRFSTVTLDKRSSETPETKDEGILDAQQLSRSSSSTNAEPITTHKKTTSTTTIRDTGRNSVQSESNTENARPNRGSLEGHQMLQEEFKRLHKEVEEREEDSGSSPVDWDFWGEVISDYPKFASERGDVLADAITRGVPSNLRGMLWQLMAASKDPELENTYSNLLKERSSHEKAIIRDLGRTFPHHEYFTNGQGVGQENLFNVLKAYSLYDPQVGYVQGLPFVVAILLLNMPDEEAFSLLVRLMHVYDLRGHFLPEMPKLQMRLFQFDRLIEELLPVLHVHFLRQGIKSSMFCSQWFLTVFSYRTPLPIVFRIYDNCLASGIEAMFGFSVALLRKNEEALLQMKFDQILSFLNTRLFDKYLDDSESDKDQDSRSYKVDDLVQDAVALRITPFMLDNYSHEYEEVLRESNKHAIEVDELRSSNRALSAQVKNLETSLAQLSTEHVELLNELVKSRLRHEETEDELVRYKLLYAEAMHENEDAGSHHRLSSNSHRSTTG